MNVWTTIQVRTVQYRSGWRCGEKWPPWDLGPVIDYSWRAGHVAHPHRRITRYTGAALMLNELVGIEGAKGNEFFPPTSMQIANIAGVGTRSYNVEFPASSSVQLNFRFSTELTDEMIKARVPGAARKISAALYLDWWLFTAADAAR